MMDNKLKSLKYYKDNRIKFNSLRNKSDKNLTYNNEWRKIAGRPYVGSCSYLSQSFIKENENKKENITFQNFADYYFSNLNPIKENGLRKNKSINYGRSVEDLIGLAKYFKVLCNDTNTPLEDFYDNIILHTLIETIKGQFYEFQAIIEYEKYGFTVKHTNGDLDSNLGVDIIIYKDGKIVDYIQVKPFTTFIGNTNRGCIKDRILFYKKEKNKYDFCIKNNLPYFKTKFILYNENVYPKKWVTLNGKRGFYLEELCDKNGMSIIDFTNANYT